MQRTLLLIIAALILAGCSAFHKNSSVQTEYLRSYEAPPLQLPPGYKQGSAKYYIPPMTCRRPTRPVSIIPPGSLLEQKMHYHK